ncbi:hypothetical protein I203_103542 [Kwoniella mangroviensis CBS 8507]|uniref:uncharacterized protein n=1 Tax=Kwoniella mangroviensis CBS 8507 TaxID=1296122 RepID=UPI00304D5813
MTIWTFLGRQWTVLPPAPKGDYLKGKVVLMTGANSGIGLESLKHLVQASPSKLILCVRSIEATEKILGELQSLHPDLKAEIVFLDLCDLNTIKVLPDELRKRGVEKIDVLINNTGANPGNANKPPDFTKDKYEKTFQINVLSPLLLSLILLPFLRESPTPKILFLGSGLHASADVKLIESSLKDNKSIVGAFNEKDGDWYNNKQIYGISKLLLQMITRSLIPSLPDINIITVSPGLAITNLGRDFNFNLAFYIFGAPFMLLNARSAEKGARNVSSAVAQADQSYDYWAECGPSYSESSWLSSGNGIKAAKAFYQEMIGEVDKISPGATKDLIV